MVESKLSSLPAPWKAFAALAMLMLALGMAVAGLQTYVKQIRHDLKAFAEYRESQGSEEEGDGVRAEAGAGNESEEEKPFLDEWRFQWLLTYTHIHSFSMTFIFFFAGALYLMSGASDRAKILWNFSAFAGILLDLGGLWLKSFCATPWVALQYIGGTLMGAAFLVMFVTVLKDLRTTRQPS